MYQPVILSYSHDTYYEIPPHSALKNWIQTFWVSPPGDTFQRVLPDFCGDIILVMSKELTIKKMFFSTPQTAYFISDGDEDYITVGIRFYLRGFPLILEAPLLGQKNEILTNPAYFSDFSTYFNYLNGFSSLFELFERLNQYFLNKSTTVKPLESETLLGNFITNAFNNLPYKDVIRKEVISERSIQRKFKEEIALSPYELYDTIRFQKILRDIQMSRKSFIDLTYDYHFHDQAHFSRTMKKYSGLSPKQIVFACRNYTRNS